MPIEKILGPMPEKPTEREAWLRKMRALMARWEKERGG